MCLFTGVFEIEESNIKTTWFWKTTKIYLKTRFYCNSVTNHFSNSVLLRIHWAIYFIYVEQSEAINVGQNWTHPVSALDLRNANISERPHVR
jgi:hypothetical protein